MKEQKKLDQRFANKLTAAGFQPKLIPNYENYKQIGLKDDPFNGTWHKRVSVIVSGETRFYDMGAYFQLTSEGTPTNVTLDVTPDNPAHRCAYKYRRLKLNGAWKVTLYFDNLVNSLMNNLVMYLPQKNNANDLKLAANAELAKYEVKL